MRHFKVTYITYQDKTVTREVSAPNKYELYNYIANCREIVSEEPIEQPTKSLITSS